MIAIAGVLDVLANVAVHLRTPPRRFIRHLSAHCALPPAGTILLAGVVLKERIAIVQWCGLFLALGASALLAF